MGKLTSILPEEYNRFYKSLEFTLEKEGGYVNDPDDPGGETKWGIAKRYHPDVDIKNLTPEQAAEIYYSEYWLPSKANTLMLPDCAVVFDAAVNPGLNHLKELWVEPFDWFDFCINRKLWYVKQVKKYPAKQKYLAGWIGRVNDLMLWAGLH